MATEQIYYKDDKELGILVKDIKTMVSFTLPTDPLNENDISQMIKYTCVKYPELSKIYYVKRGEEVSIPKYVYDRVVKNSHLIKGHVRPKLKQAK